MRQASKPKLQASKPDMNDQEQAKAEPGFAVARLDPQELLTKAIETGAGIETLERLVALAKDVREVQAREAWHHAMADFQRRCPIIKRTEMARIRTARAEYTYWYAPLDDIMAIARPLLGDLGLSVSWRSKVQEGHVVVTCRIAHVLGHAEESGEVAMPISVGEGSGANAAQRVGIATTYAKRYSLLGIAGLAPEHDDDAESLGDTKAPEAPTMSEPEAATEAAPKEPGIEDPTGKFKLDQCRKILAAHKINVDLLPADLREGEAMALINAGSNKAKTEQVLNKICDLRAK